MRGCGGNDQTKIREDQEATCKEPRPALFVGSEMEKRGHTCCDQEEMGQAANKYHEGNRLTHVARAEKRPELFRPGLEEVGYEQIEAVPSAADYDTSAKAPRVISTCEYEDSYIDKGLEEV